MSLQWTLIAGFLYAEIVLVLLLVLPIASPKRWSAIFRSKFLQGMKNQAGIYFMILLAILVLFCLDAIREMRKYSNVENDKKDGHIHLDLEMQGSMRLFRAQRNFYISGFALFLSLVIRRLVLLISSQAALLAQSEASMKQAQSASAAARNLLSHQGEIKENTTNEVHDEKISTLNSEIDELKKKLKVSEQDRSAIKSQAENLTKEYDRLLEEHSKLQKKVGGAGDKKEE